jgi:hypothetical protein
MNAKSSHKPAASHSESFGLTVGVFVDEHPERPPYGEQNTYLERLALKACELKIRLYSFSIPQANIGRGCLTVRWPDRSFALSEASTPDVVYDRSIFAKRSDKLAARQLLDQLRTMGALVFNPTIGSKLKIHKYLSSRLETSRYLPVTAQVTDLAVVHRLLDRFGDVYIKPSVGTQGSGVLRVYRQGHGFSASGFTNTLSHIEYTDLREKGLDRLLRSIIGSRTYMVQQTIDTITWCGSKSDVRSLVQRDGSGVWRVTGIAARVAPSQGEVCNLHRGGTAIALVTLLNEAGLPFSRVYTELHRASIAVSQALTLRYPLLGELGLDFIVSKSGRIWLIEANPRPGRSIFRSLRLDDVACKSVERPLEYAAYLVSSRPGGRNVVQCRA